MNNDATSIENGAMTILRIRQAIAQAQQTCQLKGQDSQACAMNWDHALSLQLEQFNQMQKQPGAVHFEPPSGPIIKTMFKSTVQEP